MPTSYPHLPASLCEALRAGPQETIKKILLYYFHISGFRAFNFRMAGNIVHD